MAKKTWSRKSKFTAEERKKIARESLTEPDSVIVARYPGLKPKALADLDFAFEKALDKRGISADLMTSVVEMWAWILETPLPGRAHYAHYGLPILKAAALAWGCTNPIGGDLGNEAKYAEER